MNASEFFALPPSLRSFAEFFAPNVPVWEWIKRIGPALAGTNLEPDRRSFPPGLQVEGRVWIHPSVRLPTYGTLIGPIYIGAETELRPGVFVRGNVIVGEGCVLGNACEFKNCLLLDRAQVPHFNYVGDSILGNGAHLGAGVICSNLRLDQREIEARLPAGSVPTGLRKFGAILGDKAEVGCNAVLNPGSLLGPRSLVMPLVPFNGYLPPDTIAHARVSLSQIPRRD